MAEALTQRQQIALWLDSRGWVVVPAYRADHPSGGKLPIGRDWQTRQRMRPDQIAANWGGGNPPNISILTGTPSGIFVVDIDPDAGGMESIQSLVNEHGPLPTTFTVQTGGGGWHLYFQMPDFHVGNRAGTALGRGVDIRGTGGQVVAPGSVSNKGPYTPAGDPNTPVAPAPEWLLERLRTPEPTVAANEPITAEGLAAAGSYERSAVDACLARLDRLTTEAQRAAAAGQPYAGEPWDATTYYVACRLLEIANAQWSQLTPEQVEQLVWQHAPRDPGFDDQRVADKIRSARNKIGTKAAAPPTGGSGGTPDFIMELARQQGTLPAAPGGPTPPPQQPGAPSAGPSRGWTDVDNGMRIWDATQGRLLWLADAGTWAEWDGKTWETGVDLADDVAQAVLTNAVVVERGLYAQLDEKQYAKVTSSAGSSGGIRAAAVSLKRSRLATARLTDFDQRPDLLRATNGVIDLRTGELLAPSPELRLLKGTSVDYDPHAQAPEFERWLKHAQPDQAMRDYLQMAIGISLTGEPVKRYWVHEGVADAGKSMLIRLMTKALGDTAVPISDSLIEGRSKVFADDYHRAALRGARLAVLDETRQDGHALETSIKQLVGGATMVGRNPGERPFQFEPTFKLHIATNNAPTNSPDPAIRNRLALVRWEVGSTEEERRAAVARLGMPLDAYLLRHELPGILAWAVRGAARWYEAGMVITTPAAVTRATDEHIAEGDLVARWLREETYEKEGGVITGMQGWTSFRSWKERIGERGGPGTMTAWGREMSRLCDMDPSMSKARSSRAIEYRGRMCVSMAWGAEPPASPTG
jgi:P4 family phage/plasmid primase-like protien